MTSPKAIWIEKGYEMYAFKGFESLKVEPLSKCVGISKSSFYHHFADLECFTEKLYEHHFDQCALIGQKEERCSTIQPELIGLLMEHKVDLLFHRQLRIYRNDQWVEEAFVKSNALLGNYAVMLWAKEINLKFTNIQLKRLFELATDDFYMKINAQNINASFLINYFENLSQVTKHFV